MNTIHSFVNTHNFIHKINALIFVFLVLSSCTISFAIDPIDLDTSFGQANPGTDHTLLGERNKTKNDSNLPSQSNTQSSTQSNTQSIDPATLDFLLQLNKQTVSSLFKAHASSQPLPKKTSPFPLVPVHPQQPQEPHHVQPSTDARTSPNSNQAPDLSIDFTLSSFTHQGKLIENILAAQETTIRQALTFQENAIAGSVKIKFAENRTAYSICACLIVLMAMGIAAKKYG